MHVRIKWRAKYAHQDAELFSSKLSSRANISTIVYIVWSKAVPGDDSEYDLLKFEMIEMAGKPYVCLS